MLKKITACCLLIFLCASFIRCNMVEEQKMNEQDVILKDNGKRQSDVGTATDEVSINVNHEKILNGIDADMMNLAKYILSLNTDLAGMEKEYGAIMEVDWDEGAFY